MNEKIKNYFLMMSLCGILMVSASLSAVELAPDIAVNPVSWDAGQVEPWADVSQTFTFSNTGNDTLSVTDLHVSGPDREMFPLFIYNGPFLLAPGETQDVTVKFNPTSQGAKNAWIRLECNDPDQPVFEVDMNGYCHAPEIAVNRESVPFGDLPVSQSEEETVTITNTGDVNLTMPLIEIIGYPDSPFHIVSGAPEADIAPGESHDILLRFLPTSVGEFQATLHMYSDDPDEAIVDVPLTGRGVAPEIEVTPESKNFNTCFIGDSLKKNFKIKNLGNSNLVITELNLAGDEGSAFKMQPVALPYTIPPGELLTFWVGFFPVTSGDVNAILWIDHNDTDERGMEIPLSGCGLDHPPDIDLTPASYDYGDVAVGDSASHLFTVTNTGTGDLQVSEVKFLHEDVDQFRIGDGGGVFTLAPQETRQVRVWFVPTQTGSKLTHLKFYSNDPDENPKWATLTGNANTGEPEELPDIDLTPASYDYGDVAVGDSASHLFTVTNTGTGDLQVSEVKFLHEDVDQFRIGDGGGVFTLAPQETRQVRVWFVPTQTGSKLTHLKFYSNDPDENPKWATLTGNANTGEPEELPDIELEPSNLDFGHIAVGDTSSQTLLVINRGNANLSIARLGCYLGAADEFHLVRGGGAVVLAPFEAREITLEFRPLSQGRKSTYFKVFSNDPDENPARARLVGKASETLVQVEITPQKGDFPETVPGDTASLIFQLSNRGALAVSLQNLFITGPDSLAFTLATPFQPGRVEPNHEANFMVHFHPEESEMNIAFLQFVFDDSTLNTRVKLQGRKGGVDEQSPVLHQSFPVDGSKNVPQNTDICLIIKDFPYSAGLDQESLTVLVNDSLIIEDGFDLTGGHVIFHNHFGKIKATYQPSMPFEEGSTARVTVYCCDLATPPHELNASFDFSIHRAQARVTAQDTVDQSGGTVRCDTTDVEISIPQGALEDTTQITIAEVDDVPALPDSVHGVGLKYHFGPDGLTFNEAVTVRFPYSPDDLVGLGVDDPMMLEVFYYHTSTGEWVKLEVVNADSNYIYVRVNEFCYLNLGRSTSTSSVKNDAVNELPSRFILNDNFPNPFNPVTTIPFELPAESHVVLEIFNSQGQWVDTLLDENRGAGRHEVRWSGINDQGRPVASGIYYAILRSRQKREMLKMMLLK